MERGAGGGLGRKAGSGKTRRMPQEASGEFRAGWCLPGGSFVARGGLRVSADFGTAILKTRLLAGFWDCGCSGLGNTSFK
jgi:hypothetical protein